MAKSTGFVTNDSQEQINKYLNEICADPQFLCNNKDLCATNSIHYANKAAVDKICEDIKEAKKCDTDFSECMVSTINTFDEDKNNITTNERMIINFPIGDYLNENSPKNSTDYLNSDRTISTKSSNYNTVQNYFYEQNEKLNEKALTSLRS